MSAIEQIEQLSLDDFISQYSREPFELIEGERKPLMTHVIVHQLMMRVLFRLLDTFSQTNHLGEVMMETPYALLYSSTWVKGSLTPDLMFISAARWQQFMAETADWLHKPFLLVPDLVIEIVSPNDLYTEIEDKVIQYRADGVRLIWVVDPQRSRVSVYQSDQFTRLSKEDTLSGKDVLPGLEISLTSLFADAN